MKINTAVSIVPLSFLLLTACPGPSDRKDEVKQRPTPVDMGADQMGNETEDPKVSNAGGAGGSSRGQQDVNP